MRSAIGNNKPYDPMLDGEKMPFYARTHASLVAVNPERVITIGELMEEFYGNKCARCGAVKHRARLTGHHRHYRTIGFEKPGEDIVQLCHACHNDIHERTKQRLISKDDLPFVDPEWEASLPTQDVIDRRIKVLEEAAERAEKIKTYPLWKAVFETKEGLLKYDTGPYATLEDAQRNFEIERDFYGYARLVSFERV